MAIKKEDVFELLKNINETSADMEKVIDFLVQYAHCRTSKSTVMGVFTTSSKPGTDLTRLATEMKKYQQQIEAVKSDYKVLVSEGVSSKKNYKIRS